MEGKRVECVGFGYAMMDDGTRPYGSWGAVQTVGMTMYECMYDL